MVPVDTLSLLAAQQQATLLPATPVLSHSYGAATDAQHSLLASAALLVQQQAGTSAPEQDWQAGPAADQEYLAADPSMHVYVPLRAQQHQQHHHHQQQQHHHHQQQQHHHHQQQQQQQYQQYQQYQQQHQQTAALLADQLAGSLHLQPTAGLEPSSVTSHIQYMHPQQE
jgi:hypothetical protein